MNYWNEKNVPHKGFIHQGIEELESATHTCEMCGKEEIRFVHTMYHPELPDYKRVGCVCAEKMTNDYNTPKEKERIARNKSMWIRNNWNKIDICECEEKSFNSIYGRITVGIFKVKDNYRYHLDYELMHKEFDTKLQAKRFVFETYKD